MPEASVVVAVEVPFIKTVAPDRGWLVVFEVTVPETERFCAIKFPVPIIKRKEQSNSFVFCLIVQIVCLVFEKNNM